MPSRSRICASWHGRRAVDDRDEELIDLVVIGAGAAGATLLVHLLREDAERLRSVVLVEPNEPAEGLAFSRPERSVLCNTSVALNTLFPGDEDHFLRWLRARGEARRVHLSSFVPRRLFGDYVKAFFADALGRAPDRGVAVDHLATAAREVEVSAAGFRVVTSGGRTLPARNVAICTGLGVSSATAMAVGEPRGALQPAYGVPSYDEFLPARPRVVVVGTRQSAIDAAVLAAEARPDASIVMMSRSGRFPGVRTEMRERPGTSFTVPSLLGSLRQEPQALVRTWCSLLRREGADAAELESSGGDGVRRLRRDLDLAASGVRPWERVDRNAITVANEVWPLMTAPQREAVHHAFRFATRRFVTAIPAENAERILHLHEEGRLRVVRGPRRWRTRHGRIDFEDFQGDTITADRALDATGFTAFDKVEPVAVAGRGLSSLQRHVDPSSSSIRVSATSRLFLVGPPIGEALAVTNYMNTTVRQAARAASCFAERPAVAC